MKNKIYFEKTQNFPTFKRRFELVERKGLGHPDTICDLIMNEISVELSKFYHKETGMVQHHNMDKGLLVAGQSQNKLGGGKITKPMKLVIGDRATFKAQGKNLPVSNIVLDTAKSWFDKNLRFVTDDHIKIQVEVGPTSQELSSIFEKPESFGSNDTSALVGYAPNTETESLVLDLEHYLNSKKFKKEFPESGEDVKIMAFRNNQNVDITIAMAFVDRFIDSEQKYFSKKEDIIQTVNEFLKAKSNLSSFVKINCLDKAHGGLSGMYLTVLGTSADNADSGEVGRGNMFNGLISPTRPAGAEAASGKNPVSHIGKIYNALSFKIANDIYLQVSGIDEVYVWMYNVIGNPIKEPSAVIVQPITNTPLDQTQKYNIEEIIESNLQNMDSFCKNLITNKILTA